MLNLIQNKIAGVMLAAILCLGSTGLLAALPGTAHAAPPPAATVGVVDFGLLVDQHPDTPKANEAIKAEAEAAKNEFDAKAAGLGDKEKQDLNMQLMMKVEQKRQELLSAIAGKINAAVREVAAAKGLTIVVPKGMVIYGGQDITAEVLKKLR